MLLFDSKEEYKIDEIISSVNDFLKRVKNEVKSHLHIDIDKG
jgi:hypothetical protein